MSYSKVITEEDLTNILNEVLPISSNNVYTKDYTVTTGTSQYDGYYYADINNAVPSGYTPVSVFAVATSAGQATNVYLDAQFLGRVVRVWSVRASTTATVRVTYAAHSIVVPFEAADHVVEQGTSGIWTYRKWNSGLYEAWTSYDATGLSLTTSSAGTYYSSSGYKELALPSFSLSVTNVLFSDRQSQSSGVHVYDTEISGSNLRVWYRAFASVSNGVCGAYFEIKGTWK